MTFRSNKKAALAFSALAVGVASFSTQAYAAQIQGIAATQITATTTQLRISFDGTPVSPVAYQQTGSNQLVLDFNQVGGASLPRNTAVNTGVISDVVALNNGSTTRLMVNLNSTATYSSSVEGNQLVLNVIDMGSSSPVSSAQPQTMNVVVNPLLSPANAQNKRMEYDGVSSVNYKAAGAGGEISIALTSEAVPVDVQRQGNKIVVRTTGATIPRHLLKRLNAGGLVQSIDANNQGQNGVLTINMSGDYEYQAYQSGSQLHISVKPPKMLTEPTLEEKVYKGEPLSMEFQDVSVRTVLDVLAQFTGMNIVADDAVAGNITLRLINVPWDQALDIILESKNLGKLENGGVILIAPADTLAARQAKKLKDLNEIKDLSPLRTEYIRLSYAKAEDVLQLFEKATTNSRGNDNNGNQGLLSPRGSVISDSRTNTLIIKDTSESINNIRAMIEKIDIPVSQVMIEARIVTATDKFSKDLGVRWGFLHAGNSLGMANNASTMSSYRTSNGEAWEMSMVDLGVANPTSSIIFSILGIPDSILDLELSAMQADNRGEVISSPKVLTADKQKAKILSGTKIPYQTASSSGATTIQWVDAALVLEATPNITPDGKIGLELLISNGTPTTASNGAIAVTEDSISTNVILEDGQTMVLGGVFRHNMTNNVNKAPFLGDLPYVGRLFKNETRRNDKEELLIFITPKLVNDGVSRIN